MSQKAWNNTIQYTAYFLTISYLSGLGSNCDNGTKFNAIFVSLEESTSVPLLEDSKCKLCSKVFSTKASLLNHEESVANRIR